MTDNDLSKARELIGRLHSSVLPSEFEKQAAAMLESLMAEVERLAAPVAIEPALFSDHPDFVGGVRWSDCELRWIAERDKQWEAMVAQAKAQSAVPDADHRRAMDLLAYMFEKYEDGPSCYENPEEYEGFLGQAVRLGDEEFNEIVTLLTKHRPVVSEAPAHPASEKKS